MRPYLTIGMPTRDDYPGVWTTIQGLREFHDMSRVELLIVDNKPGTAHSKETKRKVDSWSEGNAGCRYIEMPTPVGTAAAKNRVFKEARGEVVWCTDSHCLFSLGAVAKTIAYFEERPDCMDLISGPMKYDRLSTIATHFADVWRGEMWGVWAQAWEEVATGFRFSVYGHDKTNRVVYLTLEMDPKTLTHSPASGKRLPDIRYGGHERTLQANGFRELGHDDGDIFEVPGMGCGLMVCRKKAWLGFNENFVGFGGEEMYIHQKFRQAGRTCICLPWLKWPHRFSNPAAKYRPRTFDKVRNCLIGRNELGMSIEPAREMYVGGKHISASNFERIAADPLALKDPMERSVSTANVIDNAFAQAVANKGNYFSEHLEKWRELASQCDTVQQISRYRETTTAVMAARPKILRSLIFGAKADDAWYAKMDEAAKAEGIEHTLTIVPEYTTPEIEPCDMLLFKTPHAYADLGKDLEEFAPKVARYIVLHDTARNGERLDGGGPGYNHALRFFTSDHPEWFVVYFNPAQCGTTILGRLESDRPAQQIHAWLPGKGTGTTMKKMLKGVGIKTKKECTCNKLAANMDLWGVEGCRERRQEIIDEVKKNLEKWGWGELAAAAARAAVTGLAFKISIKDPIGSLIDEAIRLTAEEEAAEKAKAA